MAIWTTEIATDITLPNITVYRKYKDGVLKCYEVYSNDGYVMHDTTANNTEPDPITGEEVPVIYYYTWLTCPLSINFNNFTWVAVPREGIDENHIFSIPEEPDHEVM